MHKGLFKSVLASSIQKTMQLNWKVMSKYYVLLTIII